MRPALRQAHGGESGAGFARLPGDIESGLVVGVAGEGGGEGERGGTVTTRVGTSPSGFEERPAAVVPESILRQQTVEQHHHHRRISEV